MKMNHSLEKAIQSDSIPSKQTWIPFCGRPNAGKSSLISILTGKKLQSGKKPGTTSNIKKIPIFRDLEILDLPGFGRLSRRSKKAADRIKTEIIRFLEGNKEKILVSILIIDLTTFFTVFNNLQKKGILPIDIEFLHFLIEITSNKQKSENVFIVANKIDKLNSRELETNLEFLAEQIPKGIEIYPISCRKRLGAKEFRNKLKKTIISKKGRQYQGFLSK